MNQSILVTKSFGVFLTIEWQRSEYRLQPAGLGSPTLPAEAGTLNAVSWAFVIHLNGYFLNVSHKSKHYTLGRSYRYRARKQAAVSKVSRLLTRAVLYQPHVFW